MHLPLKEYQERTLKTSKKNGHHIRDAHFRSFGCETVPATNALARGKRFRSSQILAFERTPFRRQLTFWLWNSYSSESSG